MLLARPMLAFGRWSIGEQLGNPAAEVAAGCSALFLQKTFPKGSEFLPFFSPRLFVPQPVIHWYVIYKVRKSHPRHNTLLD